MGWRDYIPDSAEDLAEDFVEATGDAIEWGGNKTAGVAEKVGLDDAGDWIRDKSRSAANRLGADVGELELGQTEDPKKLVYGSVAKIRAQVSHLNDFKASFEQVGNGLKGIGEPDGLKGKSAEAFRTAVAKEPPRWFEAAEAFGKAADAMGRFAETVEWAQGQAKEALEDYTHAQKVSTDARDAYSKQADAYRDAVKAKKDHLPPRPVDPEDFVDPGKPLIAAARDKLASARKQRDEVAETTRTAVCAARDKAPKKPSYAEQLSDGLDYFDLAKTHLVGGVLKGTAGTLNFARGINPLDLYNITHPAEYRTNLNSTAMGLITMANDPWGAGMQMLDEFMKDSNEGVGRMIPDFLGGKGMGAGKRFGSEAKHLDDTKPGGSRGDHEKDPNHNSNKCRDNVCHGDPVDMATGRMLLPQTDITLPGSLPLVFQRTFDSSHRSGRWFGPAWSSTVDQRLEIDTEGVVFSCDEGSLLAYPHPAPGVPVMPTHGRRWPLDRVQDGYTLTDPDTGRVWRFVDHSDELALLAQIEDRNGRSISFEHDEAGAPTAIVHHGGYHLKLTTSDGRVTALHLAGAAADGSDQEILRYGYTDGHLTEVTNSSGRPLRFDCDEHGRITAWTDTNGSRYDYVYDDQDRCTYQTGTNGHVESRFTWDETDPATGLRMTSTTDGLGHTKRFMVNERSQIVAELDPLGAVTQFEYDRHNRLLSRTDPLGHISRFTHDERGRMTVLERPDGRQARAEYDDNGMPIRIVGTDGNVTRQTFDERGNRTSVTDPSGATTQFAYNAAGRLTAVTDPLGSITRLVLDPRGLPVEVTDPSGATTRYEHDGFGRRVQVVDALGAQTHTEWTVEGWPSRRTAPDGTVESWTYDGEGNCLSHTDSTGGTTRFAYTDFDLLTARTAPDGIRHEFSYDTNLRLTRVTNPQGLTWEYTYDAAGRLVTETDFDGRALSYDYDPSGRLVSRANGLGQRIDFTHNALGQVIRKEVEGTGATTFEYDIFDELAVATSPDAELERLRDRYGHLQSETVNGRTLTYKYDELGRRVGRTTPGGAVSEWSYDAAGRRTKLTTSGRDISFSFDALGREVGRTVSDFVALTSSFDEMNRLKAQTITSGGSRLQHRAYAYGAGGGLVGVSDALSGARGFDVDSAGRVTAVHAHGWTERYAYDDAGNQTEASWPATHPSHSATGARTYEGTRIASAGAVRYEHDGQGRVVLRQRTRLSRKPDTWRYEWDAEDRLTAVTTPDGTLWQYAYDPLGRRISKQCPSETVHFTWDGTTLCEQTTANVVLTWDHAGQRPLSQTERRTDTDDERFFAIITDLIGTPTELVDESGELAWRTRTTLWGTTTWNRDATTYTPIRFPGQHFDPESGLHYNYFRYYDPESARYLSQDPLGLGPADNPVTYVHNPHTWSDPLGLSPCPPRIPGGGWDLRGGADPLSILPKDAVQEAWRPIPGGVEHGIKWSWKDPVTGLTARLRVHEADLGPHAGPNASSGPIYRIQIGNQYQDEAGQLYHRKIGNPNSDFFDEAAVNDTHIPWPSHLPLPYPH
ncbi:putative T7SS-secreted protein [Streptomyces sp. NBC_00273]|uniref:putative T7SS-secreted protein n=1 Tax=Streptomyces sp. NBC_00273 TaxID=2903644 RepID=UPI002E29A73E|nr:polymorphic toxin type 30 domain-containing protein [Streptomyces sp. NBC_00273]